MTLARDLIDAALAADLSQNELRIFLALFRQTLCYGKASDPLTLRRLIDLTHIRKDRLIPALNRLLERGIFNQTPHRKHEHRYSIAAHWLENAQGIYAPSLHKTDTTFRETEALSVEQNHTLNNLNIINQTSTTKAQSAVKTESLPYPPSFNAAQRQNAARIVDGLPPEQARDCLLLLSKQLKTKTIHSPLGYLHYLAKSARQNALETSSLTPDDAPDLKAQQRNKQRMQYLQAEIRGLDALFKQAGTPLDKASTLRREAWVREYQQLLSAQSI